MVRLSLNPSPGVAGEGASCTAGKESGTLRKGERGRNTAKLPWGITAPEGSVGELKTLGKVRRSVPS